jgi:hypothetical protein
MPSFLSKVFGRRKQDDHNGVPRPSDVSLLEGKFEVVSPTVSPTAAHFPETVGKEREKGKDGLFNLSRSKPGPTSPNISQSLINELPHLTLNLTGPKETANARALGVVFDADPDSQVTLPDSVIGERRLSPAEALSLVKTCSQAITARGMPAV